MHAYLDAAAIAAAPTNTSLDPHLRQLLADRVHDWETTDLLDLTYLVIVQAGDTEDDILRAVPYSPLANPLNGSRAGSPSFVPPWSYFERHTRWAELIEPVGNEGAAFVLFIEETDETDPALRDLCRTYAEPAGAVP